MLNIRSQLAMLTSQINNLVSIIAAPYYGDYSSSWYDSSAPGFAPSGDSPLEQEKASELPMHVTHDKDVPDNEAEPGRFFKELQLNMQAESFMPDFADIVGSWDLLEWSGDGSMKVHTPPAHDVQATAVEEDDEEYDVEYEPQFSRLQLPDLVDALVQQFAEKVGEPIESFKVFTDEAKNDLRMSEGDDEEAMFSGTFVKGLFDLLTQGLSERLALIRTDAVDG